MSERQYFSLRYAIPGYTFILLIIGINHRPLFKILTIYGLDFGAFLGFLSLLSGGAIGFLVSQIWWLRFQWKVSILGLKEYKKSVEVIFKVYGLEKPQCNKDKQRKYLTAIDYITHSRAEKNVLTLSERRWALYHILSSTVCSLLLGAIAGTIYRIYFEFTVFNGYFLIKRILHGEFIPEAAKVAATAESGPLICIFVIVVFLSFILWVQKKWIATMCASLHEARIRSSMVTQRELKEAFPDLFEESEK